MKYFSLIVILILISPACAPAQSLFVDVHNFASQNIINRRVTLTLLEPGPVTAGPWLIAGDSIAQFTDTNGFTTFSNVLAGGYRLDIAGAPARSFPLGMPATNGTVNAASLIGSTNTLPLYYSVDQLAQMGIPPFGQAVTNSQTGVILGLTGGTATNMSSVAASNFYGAFNGSGAGLTSLPPAASLTNATLITPTLLNGLTTSQLLIITNGAGIGLTGFSTNDLILLVNSATRTNLTRWHYVGPDGQFVDMLWWPDHGGTDDPELAFDSSGSIAFVPGLGGFVGGQYLNDRFVQIGNPDYRGGLYLNNDHTVVATNALGWSQILYFRSSCFSNGAANTIQPGFFLRSTDTNGNAELDLFDNMDTTIYPPYTNWAFYGTTPRARFRVTSNASQTNAGFDLWGTFGATNWGWNGQTFAWLDANNSVEHHAANVELDGALVLTNFQSLTIFDNRGNTLFHIPAGLAALEVGPGVGNGGENGVDIIWFDLSGATKLADIGYNGNWIQEGGLRVMGNNTQLSGVPQAVANGFTLEGDGNVWATNSLTVGPVNGLGGSVITNCGLAWLSTNLAPGVAPTAALPNGSICTTTNGAFYVRSNGVWVLH